MNRIFHQRFTIAAKSGITILTLLAFWFFLQRQAVVGLLLVILLVVMIERVVHTRYIFREIPFDSQDNEKQNVLTIDKGRFSHPLDIPLESIKNVNIMSTTFHLSHYILIKYGEGKIVSFQPEDEQAFLSELKKRSK